MSEEGSKFFRYVMPGLVFIIETLLFAYIVMPFPTEALLKDHFTQLGEVVTAFLASGALGFIFASIHHSVRWLFHSSCFEKDIFDHRDVIRKLLVLHPNKLTDDNLKNLGLERNGNALKNFNSIEAKMEALKISQSLWYRFLEENKSGKDSIDRLGHQAHGLGAARVASVVATIIGLLLCYLQYPTADVEWWRYVLMPIMGILAILMFHSGYSRVADLAHGAYTIILLEELTAEEKSVSCAPEIAR